MYGSDMIRESAEKSLPNSSTAVEIPARSSCSAVFATTGSGSLHANTVIKLGFNRDQSRDAAVALVANALYEAADEDAATGGPDLIREVYPIIATISADGFDRIEQDEAASVFAAIMDDRRRLGGGEEVAQ